MTRPTRGREAPAATRRRPASFPGVLATALDRTSRGEQVGAPPGRPVPGRSARWPGRAGARPGRVVDTPEPFARHLNETVEPAARPLWRAFLRSGDPGDRRRVIEHYGDLVRGVGGKLAGRLPASVELADLVQSGMFGLMEAVDRFDPARGVPFEGYAAQRVRGAMLDELRAQDWVPRAVRARGREVERAREVLHARLARPATERELAAELGIGLRELRAATRPLHLVDVDDLHREGHPGTEAVPQDDTDPFLVVVRRETSVELRGAIDRLDGRDRLVLRLYYLEGRTLAEIGAMLGVTESRVCQLHTRMISRLRGRLGDRLDRAVAG